MKLWEIFLSIDLPEETLKCLWSFTDIFSQAKVRKGKLLFSVPPSALFPGRGSPPHLTSYDLDQSYWDLHWRLQCNYPQWGESTHDEVITFGLYRICSPRIPKLYQRLLQSEVMFVLPWPQANKDPANKAHTVYFAHGGKIKPR